MEQDVLESGVAWSDGLRFHWTTGCGLCVLPSLNCLILTRKLLCFRDQCTDHFQGYSTLIKKIAIYESIFTGTNFLVNHNIVQLVGCTAYFSCYGR